MSYSHSVGDGPSFVFTPEQQQRLLDFVNTNSPPSATPRPLFVHAASAPAPRTSAVTYAVAVGGVLTAAVIGAFAWKRRRRS